MLYLVRVNGIKSENIFLYSPMPGIAVPNKEDYKFQDYFADNGIVYCDALGAGQITRDRTENAGLTARW